MSKAVKEKSVKAKENGVAEKNDNLNEALVVLIQAAELAQKEGAFSLSNAAVVAQAVSIVRQHIEDTKSNSA